MDRVAVSINGEASTSATLAYTDSDLIGRRAIVFSVLQEVSSPQLDHTSWHDIDRKAVEAYHRRGFAILYGEGVFVFFIVAATIGNEPLDLVGTMW